MFGPVKQDDVTQEEGVYKVQLSGCDVPALTSALHSDKADHKLTVTGRDQKTKLITFQDSDKSPEELQIHCKNFCWMKYTFEIISPIT